MWAWLLVVRRRRASSLVPVMPIKEDSAHREEEHKGCADGNDQVHSEIPAVALHHVCQRRGLTTVPASLRIHACQIHR
jgi:hypothetical protein